MALHNVLPFAVPAPAPIGRRQRVRPADIIPLRPRLRRRRRSLRTALFAFAAVALWAGAVFLGLLAFRSTYASTGDFTSLWSWWPIW